MRGAVLLMGALAGMQESWALNPIVIRGQFLYDSVTKDRFYLKVRYFHDTDDLFLNLFLILLLGLLGDGLFARLVCEPGARRHSHRF